MTTYAKGGYSVVKHKELQTSDGYAMTGTLCKDGKSVGTYEDGGHGGPMITRFPKIADQLEFEKYLKSLPPVEFHGRTLEVSDGMFVCFLVEEFINERRLNRLKKTQLVFTVPGDKEGAMRTVKHEGRVDAARQYVLKKYPGATIL